MEKAQLEQSVEENKERMEKLEGYWGEAQSLCQAVDEHLRETQAQYQALERKYSKAKRLIKDYQQKYAAGAPGLGMEVGGPQGGAPGPAWWVLEPAQGWTLEASGNLGPPEPVGRAEMSTGRRSPAVPGQEPVPLSDSLPLACPREIEFLKKETAQRRVLEESELARKEEMDKLLDKVGAPG